MIQENDSKFVGELDQIIDEILYYIWDPIGVGDATRPQTRDEYSSYVYDVRSALVNKASATKIRSILEDIMTEKMGLSPEATDSQAVAEVLVYWTLYLTSRHQK